MSAGEEAGRVCRRCGLSILEDKTIWSNWYVGPVHLYKGECVTRLCAEVERLQAVERDSLDSAAKAVVAWANVTFPDVIPETKVAHLCREALELYENPTSADEMADVFILLAHLADGCGVNLAEAVRAKLEINKGRTWGEPDEAGVIEHVRDATEGRG